MPTVADNSPEFNPQSDSPSSSRHETRPGWANCVPPRNPKGEHPPDFIGVTAIEGRKYCVNIYLKLDPSGNEFVSVQLKPFEP